MPQRTRSFTTICDFLKEYDLSLSYDFPVLYWPFFMSYDFNLSYLRCFNFSCITTSSNLLCYHILYFCMFLHTHYIPSTYAYIVYAYTV